MALKAELWMSRFAEWMRLRNWSEQTVVSYQRSLVQFLAYLESQGVSSPGEVTRDLMEGFRTEL